jgi:hypothetical protein
VSERLRTLSAVLLLAAVLDRLASSPSASASASASAGLVWRVDGKPLPVGPFSKDRDARRGHAAGGLIARGYKLFAASGDGAAPAAWALGPMSRAEPQAAREDLVPRLAERGAAGYLVGDVAHDSNPLHGAARPRGLQVVAPRKRPGTGLGHTPKVKAAAAATEGQGKAEAPAAAAPRPGPAAEHRDAGVARAGWAPRPPPAAPRCTPSAPTSSAASARSPASAAASGACPPGCATRAASPSGSPQSSSSTPCGTVGNMDLRRRSNILGVPGEGEGAHTRYRDYSDLPQPRPAN